MREKKLQWDRVFLSVLSYTVLFVFGMACLIPFCIVFASSFTAETALLRNGYSLWPEEFSFEAYRYVFANPTRILWAYGNTIMVTVIGIIVNLFREISFFVLGVQNVFLLCWLLLSSS